MQEEEKGKRIHAQLALIMAEVEAIGKNRKNETQNFKYRGIEDVVNMLHPLFAKHKVFILTEILEDKTEDRETANKKKLIYRVLKVKVSYVSGEDGSQLSVSVIGEGMDSGDKAANKAMSAALKYALSQTFVMPYAMVDGDKDTPPESVPADKKEDSQQQNTLQIKLIEQMANDGISNIELLKYCIAKQWLKADGKLADLPDQLIAAMLVPENWEKVKTAIPMMRSVADKISNSKPAETEKSEPLKSEQTAFNSKLYTAMELAGVKSGELKTYLLGKKYITEDQTIDNLPKTFVDTMTTDENWDKVVNAIKKARK